MLSDNNKYLTVRPGVMLNEITDPVIAALDEAFKDLPSEVSSGHRPPEHQLQVIKDLAKQHNVGNEVMGFYNCAYTDKAFFAGRLLYTWQVAWSRLLEKGVRANPPLPADVLFDYIRNGINKRGETIGPSEHEALPETGRAAFDISTPNQQQQRAAIIQNNIGKTPGLRAYTIEGEQACVHVSCIAVPAPHVTTC